MSKSSRTARARPQRYVAATITVRLDQGLAERVEAYADRVGKPLGEIARDALRAYLPEAIEALVRTGD